MTELSPVYDLAGQQTDPLAERVLAILFTDEPARELNRREDSHNHWQWLARPRDDENRGSRLWLSSGEIITDDTVSLMQSRATKALERLVPRHAKSVAVTVAQTGHSKVAIDVRIGRVSGEDLTMSISLEQGVPSA